MNKVCLITMIVLISFLGNGLALELTSVSPSRGVPGTPVTITGGPFSQRPQVFFGAQPVLAVVARSGTLNFPVPPLQPGSYTLRVQDSNAVARQSYTFEVLEPMPRISSISPRNLDSCSDTGELGVAVEGSYFLPGAVLLFNGSALPVQSSAGSRLEFHLPPGLPAGVYGVQVRNPGGASSLPQSLWVNNIPGISSVERGADFVNHYEVIIRGKNFFYNSILMVSTPGSSLPDRAHRPLTLEAHQENLGLSSVSPPQADRLSYRDCQTLIYYRYPTSFQENDLVLQVINFDGKQSEPFSVSLP